VLAPDGLLPLNRLVASPPGALPPALPPVADCVKLSEPVVAPPPALESVTEAALGRRTIGRTQLDLRPHSIVGPSRHRRR